MLAHPSIRRILVLNAAQQGETIEDVVGAWRAQTCQGVVLSKIDEAVKLAPAARHQRSGTVCDPALPTGSGAGRLHRLSAQGPGAARAAQPGPAAWRMDAPM